MNNISIYEEKLVCEFDTKLLQEKIDILITTSKMLGYEIEEFYILDDLYLRVLNNDCDLRFIMVLSIIGDNEICIVRIGEITYQNVHLRYCSNLNEILMEFDKAFNYAINL